MNDDDDDDDDDGVVLYNYCIIMVSVDFTGFPLHLFGSFGTGNLASRVDLMGNVGKLVLRGLCFSDD